MVRVLARTASPKLIWACEECGKGFTDGEMYFEVEAPESFLLHRDCTNEFGRRLIAAAGCDVATYRKR